MAVDSWKSLREWRVAIHRSTLKPRTILLGLRLAEYASDKHGFQAWPSQETLADELGLGGHRWHVRERLDELLAAGWLATDGGGPRRAARYSFHVVTGPESAPVSARVTGPESVPVSQEKLRAQNQGQQRAQNQGQQRAQNQGHDCPKDFRKEGRKDNHGPVGSNGTRSARPQAASPARPSWPLQSDHMVVTPAADGNGVVITIPNFDELVT